MPRYSFTAVDFQNNRVIDAVDAKDNADFRRIMRTRSLIPLKFKVTDESRNTYRLKANEAAEFSRQLASMLGSGITLVRAMEILKERDFKPKLKSVYVKLHKDVQQGYTMSEAMRLQSKAFPELLVNMYASGEASGQLEHVASKMALHYEKEHRLNSKVQSAMLYPTILFIVTVLVVIIIFTGVLPKFFDLFKDTELPAVTQVIVNMSGFMQSYWYLVLIGALLLIVFIQYLLTIRKVRLSFDKFKLGIPIAGKLLKIICTARFARTLSSLYTSGISMLNALEITSTIIGNKYIENQFIETIKNVRNGEPLSIAVGGIDGFDKKLSTTILIGEESGRLDTMLESTAEAFDYEAEIATGRLVQMVGPIMIVVMAVVIGFVMLAVMMPIFTLYQNVGAM